jgi:predicted nucleotidyltransferase
MVSILSSDLILDALNRSAGSIRSFGVTKIGLFGSFLNHTATPRSDIDILVQFEQPTFDRYMDLKFYLEELFGRKVDLVIEQDIKPALEHVREQVVYAQKVCSLS